MRSGVGKQENRIIIARAHIPIRRAWNRIPYGSDAPSITVASTAD